MKEIMFFCLCVCGGGGGGLPVMRSVMCQPQYDVFWILMVV